MAWDRAAGRDGARGETRGRRCAVVALVLALAAVGCRTASVTVDAGRIHQREHGYSVRAPEAPWERARVDGAAAAFARGDALMSLQSRCRSPLTRPQILARHLIIGLPERTLRQSGPVSVGEAPGWMQTFDTEDAGRAVRIKTVTLVSGSCAIDWILSARADFDRVEPDFDAWWESFRPEAPPALPEPPASDPEPAADAEVS